MPSPSDLRYTDSHEWVRLEGNLATLGITQFAVNELTDITYVELKPAGTTVTAGDSIGEVESVKATSDIYTPAAGEIIEINEELSDDPSKVNEDPFAEGWLVRIRVDDASVIEAMMDAEAYDQKYAE
jgi:glycine cleavage system H protein